jgi:phenylpyruvate tautomerase PptA (4-oxalocrotonate tautomerase family)
MPNIIIKIPSGVLDEASRSSLSQKVTAAAAECERIPDVPANRFLCWVVIEEITSSHWTCGGQDVSGQFVPVIAIAYVAAGVLDDESRARYVRLINQAVVDALLGENRQILTSCILREVADGNWGVGGVIWRLPDFASAVGFEHQQHLVVQK